MDPETPAFSAKYNEANGSSPGFKTYREYLTHLDDLRLYPRGTPNRYGGILEHEDNNIHGMHTIEISLYQFDRNGSLTLSLNFPGQVGWPLNYTDVETRHFEDAIKGTLDNCPDCQVIILKENSMDDTRYMYPPWLVTVLGLGLDMDPRVWAYIFSSPRQLHNHWFLKTNSRRTLHVLPLDIPNLLVLGCDALLILDAGPQRRIRTAIFFLSALEIYTELEKSHLEPFLWSPPLRSKIGLEKQRPQDRGLPPGITRLPYPLAWMAVPRRCNSNTSHHGSQNHPEDILFRCMESFVQFSTASARRGYHLYKPTKWKPMTRVDYGDGRGLVERPDSQTVWYTLRDELDSKREILRSVDHYVHSKFDISDEDVSQSFSALEVKLKHEIERLESDERLIRDLLAVVDSSKSASMAEVAVKESKRVILLTSLAFVFLPLSLSTSIFGMNLQQINNSGHDIWAYLVTCIVLVICTLVSWPLVSCAIERRKSRKAVLGNKWVETELLDYILFSIPRDRIRRWWKELTLSAIWKRIRYGDPRAPPMTFATRCRFRWLRHSYRFRRVFRRRTETPTQP